MIGMIPCVYSLRPPRSINIDVAIRFTISDTVPPTLFAVVMNRL